MTCRRRRTPSYPAPRAQRQLAVISSAAQHSDAERGLTADCFNEAGKHGRGGGLLLEREEEWRGTRERRASEWEVSSGCGEPVAAPGLSWGPLQVHPLGHIVVARHVSIRVARLTAFGAMLFSKDCFL